MDHSSLIHPVYKLGEVSYNHYTRIHPVCILVENSLQFANWVTAIPYQNSARTKSSEDLVYGNLLVRTYEHCSRTVITGTPQNGRGLGLVEFFLGTPHIQVLARGPERPGIRKDYVLGKLWNTVYEQILSRLAWHLKQPLLPLKRKFLLPPNSLGNTL